jgi:hypothetical protein
VNASQHARRNASVARPLYSRAPTGFTHVRVAVASIPRRRRVQSRRAHHLAPAGTYSDEPSCGTRVRTNARVRASVSATPVLPATEHAIATLLGQGRGGAGGARSVPSLSLERNENVRPRASHPQSCAHVGPDQGRARYIPCLVLE